MEWMIESILMIALLAVVAFIAEKSKKHKGIAILYAIGSGIYWLLVLFVIFVMILVAEEQFQEGEVLVGCSLIFIAVLMVLSFLQKGVRPLWQRLRKKRREEGLDDHEKSTHSEE